MDAGAFRAWNRLRATSAPLRQIAGGLPGPGIASTLVGVRLFRARGRAADRRAWAALLGTAVVLLVAAVPASAASFVVNATGDGADANSVDSVCDTDTTASGDQCTLRAAIQQANATSGSDSVGFALAMGTTIAPTSPLPQVTDPVTIDGTTQPLDHHVDLDGSALGLSFSAASGLVVSAGASTLRGLTLEHFPQYGVRLLTSGGDTIEGDVLRGNAVGGVVVESGADDVIGGVGTIGETGVPRRNVITGNGHDGVQVSGSGSSGISIEGNSLDANGEGPDDLGIDLGANGVSENDAPPDADTGANGLQNFPVLSLAESGGGSLSVTGVLHSGFSSTYRVELFASPSCDSAGNGEGATFLEGFNATTDAAGEASFTRTLAREVPPGAVITATATSASGNTSELGPCRTVSAASTTPPTGSIAEDTGGLTSHNQGGNRFGPNTNVVINTHSSVVVFPTGTAPIVVTNKNPFPVKGTLRLVVTVPARASGSSRKGVSAGGASPSRRRQITAGKASFKLGANKKKVVKVKLTKRARKLLRHQHRLAARARLTLTDPAGSHRTVSRTIKLVRRGR